MRKRTGLFRSTLFPLIFSVVIFVTVLALFLWGIQLTEKGSRTENLRMAQQSVHNAAISCYALEGRYPPSYEYLKQNYPVSINENKYTVFYTIFASNILPDIYVTEKQDGRKEP